MSFASAVVAALRAAPGSPALVVGDAGSEGLSAPYAVVWTSRRLDGEGLDQRSDRATVDVSVSSVGASRAAADAVAARVCDVLVDAVLDVDGWTCGPLRHVGAAATRQDEDTAGTRSLWVAVDQLRLTAARG